MPILKHEVIWQSIPRPNYMSNVRVTVLLACLHIFKVCSLSFYQVETDRAFTYVDSTSVDVRFCTIFHVLMAVKKAYFLVDKSSITLHKSHYLMLKCFWLDGISWYVSKNNYFWVWGSPKLKRPRENGMSFVVSNSGVQYILRWGIFLKFWHMF